MTISPPSGNKILEAIKSIASKKLLPNRVKLSTNPSETADGRPKIKHKVLIIQTERERVHPQRSLA
ncbi:hypothetical protein D3C75_1372790 [compost metagenome]